MKMIKWTLALGSFVLATLIFVAPVHAGEGDGGGCLNGDPNCQMPDTRAADTESGVVQPVTVAGTNSKCAACEAANAAAAHIRDNTTAPSRSDSTHSQDNGGTQ